MTEAEKERAAIVGWLRNESDSWFIHAKAVHDEGMRSGYPADVLLRNVMHRNQSDYLGQLAAAIERGDHLKDK